MAFDLEQPLLLALLPLALLPLLGGRGDALRFAALEFLPVDRAGAWLSRLWRALAVAALACSVVGLAGPGIPGARVQRTGQGAEVLILFDRSSSMDAAAPSAGESKNGAARRLLTEFVLRRPDDRFALMTFGTSVMPVAPFSDHNEAVLAGLAATAVGRGLPNTNMGSALLAAIDEFRPRSYSGSRIIVLVSDGGATLDEPTRQRIRAGLVRQRLALYFIYIRDNADTLATDEVALHRFFAALPIPYHLYQADDSTAIAAALSDISGQQNLPLTFFERVQRRDFTWVCFAAAASACAAWLLVDALRIRRWP